MTPVNRSANMSGRLSPAVVEAFNRAMTSFKAGRLAEADALLHQVLETAPRMASAWHLRGLVAQSARRLPKARDMLLRAIALDPQVADFHANLAVTYIGLQEHDAAIESARAALRLQPHHFGALINLGLLLTDSGQLSEARTALEAARAEKPEIAQVHGNIGKVARLQADYETSLAAYEQANSLAPNQADYALGRATALYMLGRTKESRALLDVAAQQWPDHPGLLGARVFVLNYFADVTAEQQFAAAQAYGSALAGKIKPKQHQPDPAQAERPIRVGLVSSDLREHSVSLFLLTILPHIPREHISLVAYSTSRHTDSRTDRLRGLFEEWVDAFGLNTATLSRRIGADRIDVLLDLSGHTQGHRLPVFASKPAPVSATWLGYSGTTGVAAIDYVISDAWVAPPGDEAYLVEKPWRLPRGFLCFPSGDEQPLTRDPDRGGVVFGSFNSHNKLSDATVEAWARILHQVPGSRLLLKSRALANADEQLATRDHFAALGINVDRLTLFGRTPTPEAHMALYREVDIALDPFPYNGTATTMQALRMGVPVLALRGNRYISRVGESILVNAGLGDWVAEDVEDYIASAVRSASDRAGLARLRSDLPARIARSPAADAALFGAAFEEMLRAMWRRWCLSGTPPAAS